MIKETPRMIKVIDSMIDYSGIAIFLCLIPFAIVGGCLAEIISKIGNKI